MTMVSMTGCTGAHPTVYAPARLRTHDAGDAQRAAVEQFVATVYACRYGAIVCSFAPTLVSLSDDEQVLAAAGYRIANEPLFLERYLDAPIQSLLAAHIGAAPPRGRIAEVGHLAAARSGQGRRLILLLGQHLANQGVHWVVGTLTEELRHLFTRMGVVPLALGAADPARLGAEAADWGRYYEHRPAVLAGHLPSALRRLGVRAPWR